MKNSDKKDFFLFKIIPLILVVFGYSTVERGDLSVYLYNLRCFGYAMIYLGSFMLYYFFKLLYLFFYERLSKDKNS